MKGAYASQGCALMGVLNTTSDSFYDGGKYTSPEAIEAQVDRLLREGAEIIDVGPESSRPGAAPVPAEEQIRRCLHAVRYASSKGAFVSIDTTSPKVAEVALEAGARAINDVSCLADPDLARVARAHGADLILMHSRGKMSEMRGFSAYDPNGYADVVTEVMSEWREARDRALQTGINSASVWFDPGLGFHKSAEQSHEIMRRLAEFEALSAPVVLGASRKSFLASLDGAPPEERLAGSIAAALHGYLTLPCILRVHDVAATLQALRLFRHWSGSTFVTENAALSPLPRLKWGTGDV